MPYASKKGGSKSGDSETIYCVLVGTTGNGKSSTACTLIGKKEGDPDAFKASAAWKSETQTCSHADYEFGNKRYRIIDTPGLEDTNLSHEEVHKRLAQFCDLAPDGVDAFLFVVKQGRFSPQVADCFNTFKEACSEKALKHSMMVVPGADELDGDSSDGKEGMSQKEWRQNLLYQAEDIPNMSETLDQLGNRVVGVENRSGKKLRQAAQEEVYKSVEKIRQANNYQRYANDELQKAQQWRNFHKKAALELESEDAQQTLLNELDDCFRGRKSREQVETKLAQLQESQRHLNQSKQEAKDNKEKADRNKAEADAKAQEAADAKEQARVAAEAKQKAEDDAAKAEANSAQKVKEIQDKSAADLKALEEKNAAEKRAPLQAQPPRGDSDSDSDSDRRKKKKKKNKKNKEDGDGKEGGDDVRDAVNGMNVYVARVMTHYNVSSVKDLHGKVICLCGATCLGHYHGKIKSVDLTNEQWVLKIGREYDEDKRKNFRTTCNRSNFCDAMGDYMGPEDLKDWY